jgi:hypothetical protein
MMDVIYHPFANPIQGRRLQAGDVLRSTDVYASTTGKWERCPCAGAVLQTNVDVVWVRPPPSISDEEADGA